MRKSVWIVLGLSLVLGLFVLWDRRSPDLTGETPEQAKLCRMLQENTACPGLQIQGTDLGGLSRSEVRAVLRDKGQAVLEQTVYLEGRRKSYRFTLEQLGAVQDLQRSLEEAWAAGRRGSLEERLEALRSGAEVRLYFKTDEALLRTRIGEITRGEGGWLDQGETEKRLREALEGQGSSRILLPLPETAEAAAKAEFSIPEEVLGACRTTYDTAQEGRSVNLALAAEKINGWVLLPGEEFSYCEAVGPVTAEAGYREGWVLMGDRYIPGIGGGICQISTTLYTAVLKAELQVLERHNHGLPASYAVPGMDAAVAVEAAIDLRFRNNSANPIYIEAWAEEGTAEVKIYGTETRSSDRYVFFRTERSSWEERPAPVICEDGTKPAGYREVIEAGYQGGQIDTYKVISEGGRLTEEKISSSYYRSTPDRILVGTG